MAFGLVTAPSYTDEAVPLLLWDLERYRLVAQLEGHVGPAHVRYVRYRRTNHM